MPCKKTLRFMTLSQASNATTHLLPSLHGRGVGGRGRGGAGGRVRGVGEENHVDIVCELWHGGEDEHHRGHYHHAHRGERVKLRQCELYAYCVQLFMLTLTVVVQWQSWSPTLLK